MMSHLEDGLIHELVDGEVPSAMLAPIQQHLATCPACQARLEAARSAAAGVDALLEALDEPAAAPIAVTPAIPRRRSPHWGRQLGLAASLLVAVGIGYGARGFITAPPASPTTGLVEDRDIPSEVDNAQVREGPVAAAQSGSPAATLPPSAETQTGARARVEATTTAHDASSERQDIAQNPAREEARTEEAVAPLLPPAPPTGRAQEAPSAVSSFARRAPESQLVPRDQVNNAAKALAAPIVIDLPEAISRLGGTLRLVEGLVPMRLEALGDEVRVIYPTTEGDLVLSQRRVGIELRWSLTAPEHFPADSLATLRGRVRP